MRYTIGPETLRNLANEFREDLANTYEHLNSDGISLSDLRYWERRREALLHMRERALCFASDIERLNQLHSDWMDEQVWAREAAE